MGIIGGESQPLTRSEWADQQLRSAILRGELRPGDQVVISTLAEQLGVSATPLREALRNLAAEGLIELQAHGSARVATVNINEAVDLYEMRLALEPMALERSVAKADDAYRSRLQAAWIAMTESEEPTMELHVVFHRVLLSACDSAWLLRVTNMLSDRTTLMMVIGLQTPPPNYDIANSHRAMFEKAMAGDAAGASDELSQQLKSTLEMFNLLRLDEASNASTD
jgi:DNA-binding GntR family transcriptional regulator